MVGRVLVGRYRIEQPLGKGGAGTVYGAVDEKSGKRVAVKVLHPGADARAVARFRREAHAIAPLSHPNIVAVLDYHLQEEPWFIAMELVDGASLAGLLKREGGHLPTARASRIALQALAGLEAAHRAGIIHRDVKPANILVTTSGTRDAVKICDFGIAKLDDEGPKTTTGMTVGSPAYMSPEQLRGEQLDARTDLFSLSCTLFEMLEGRRAHGGDAAAVARAILKEPPPHASKAPPPLAAVVQRGLAKDREARFQDAAAMRDAIARVAPPRKSRALLWLVAMLVTLAAGGTALALALRRPAPPLEVSVHAAPLAPPSVVAPAPTTTASTEASAAPTPAPVAAVPRRVKLYRRVTTAAGYAQQETKDHGTRVDAAIPRFAGCYERARWRTNALHSYEIRVSADGVPTSASVTDQRGALAPELTSCLVAVLMQLRFGRPDYDDVALLRMNFDITIER